MDRQRRRHPGCAAPKRSGHERRPEPSRRGDAMNKHPKRPPAAGDINRVINRQHMVACANDTALFLGGRCIMRVFAHIIKLRELSPDGYSHFRRWRRHP